MKTLLIVFALIGAVAPLSLRLQLPKLLDEVQSAYSNCLNSNPLTKDKLESLLEINLLDIPEDKSILDFINCILAKLNIFNTETGFVTEEIQKLVAPQLRGINYVPALNKCVVSLDRHISPDRSALRLLKCMLSSDVGINIKSIAENVLDNLLSNILNIL